MSTALPDPAPLDLREQIVRIDRAIAETEKFQAEQRKLIAEQQKYLAEALKLGWDARFAPYLAFAAVIGGLLGVATFIAHLIGH
jgi:hypothetical protein